MKHITVLALGTALAALIGCQTSTPQNQSSSSNTASSSLRLQAGETRDYLKWPFPASSIWNMAIHNNAQYVDAPIAPSTEMGLAGDENILILRPNAPLKTVYMTTAGWDNTKTRCGTIDYSKTIFGGTQVPIPNDFRTDPGYLGNTPNQSAAILMPDGVTVKQTQPLHICGFGGTVVSGGDNNGPWSYPDDNLKTGDGILGAHGGPKMSSIGGSIRVGELRPGSTFRHALTLQVDGKYLTKNNNDGTKGYRWPAIAADSNVDWYYTGTNPQMEIGALVAVAPNFNVNGLRTEAAKIIARAFRDYGAYIVDTTGWDVYQLAYEWGPDGRFIDQFQSDWGFNIVNPTKPNCTDTSDSCKFAKDMADMMGGLKVIANNTSSTIGGGANSDFTNRRAPGAPPFADGTGGAPGGGNNGGGSSALSYTVTTTPATGSGAIANIKDGNTGTSWTSSANQSNNLVLQLDLGSTQTFSQISINAGSSGNYLRSYEVYASNSTGSWGNWVSGGNASNGNLVLNFSSQSARYLTIRPAGANPGVPWTIAELVVGTGSNTGGGGTGGGGGTSDPSGALSRTNWTFLDVPATGSGAIANIKDSNDSTVWTSSANQNNNLAIRIDLGSSQNFNRIILNAGVANNYLRSYEVYTSNSAGSWGNWTSGGNVSGTPSTISFGNTNARYVTLKLGYANPGVPWSISELWVAQQ